MCTGLHLWCHSSQAAAVEGGEVPLVHWLCCVVFWADSSARAGPNTLGRVTPPAHLRDVEISLCGCGKRVLVDRRRFGRLKETSHFPRVLSLVSWFQECLGSGRSVAPMTWHERLGEISNLLNVVDARLLVLSNSMSLKMLMKMILSGKTFRRGIPLRKCDELLDLFQTRHH